MSARDLIPFRFEKYDIRVVHVDGEPHFAGKDVADALGYVDATTAIRSHCRGVQKLHPIPDALGRMQQSRVLAEADVLRLIVSSTLPAAEAFERWVFEEVLPSIRRTGSYSVPVRVLTPAEMFLHNAQMMVDLEQRQLAQDVKIDRVEQRVDDLAETMLVRTRPAGSESITHMRPRAAKMFGLPERIVEYVVRQSPMAIKPGCMVLNERQEAEGGSFAVYWVKDVNAILRRFVGECEMVTACMATHPYVEGRFKLAPGWANGEK